jgi:hypothetical protein
MTARLRKAYLSSIIHQDAVFFEQVGPGEVGTRMIKGLRNDERFEISSKFTNLK